MPTTTISTTLLESVNIVLANLGESPVNNIGGGALPQQVSLALNTIEEVSTDIQSKGWWFNQQTASAYDTAADVVIHPSKDANDWSSSIPEEARRYITIRAARITQTRLIGSEELQKFSYNEELVSLAILQQAHVRNSGGVLDFNDFPSELRGLGMDEVMFLQGNVEEKMGILRLGNELATIAKTKAETDLVTQNAIKVAADTGLITNQQALIAQQVLDVVADTALKTKQGLKIDQETDLIEAQEELTDAQKATELQNAIKVAADAGLVTSQQALVAQQVLDTVADTELKGKQGSLLEKQALDVEADTSLKGKQETLLEKQSDDVVADTALKGKQGTKIDAETGLTTQQQALTAQQTLDVVADTALKGKQSLAIEADTDLKTSQKTQLDAQTAIEVTAEKDFFDNGGVVIDGSAKTYRDFAAEMRMMGFQETQFQGMPAYKKVELIKDANKLRTATATESSANGYDTGGDFYDLQAVNKIMRLIGEPPVSAFDSNSLASECVRLLRDTDKELQGRGWWFNTLKDQELVPNSSGIIDLNYDGDSLDMGPILNAEVNGVPTHMNHLQKFLFNRDTNSRYWTSPVKGTLIYQAFLAIVPDKYLEYLTVRVAILLTELYPQSGIDIQRLPKMEAELRAYFKDREADDANYSIFDNYDTASRIGFNRNYDII